MQTSARKFVTDNNLDQGSVSIADKTSYRKISKSLGIMRWEVKIIESIINLTGKSATLLRCLQVSERSCNFEYKSHLFAISRERLIGYWNGARCALFSCVLQKRNPYWNKRHWEYASIFHIPWMRIQCVMHLCITLMDIWLRCISECFMICSGME